MWRATFISEPLADERVTVTRIQRTPSFSLFFDRIDSDPLFHMALNMMMRVCLCLGIGVDDRPPRSSFGWPCSCSSATGNATKEASIRCFDKRRLMQDIWMIGAIIDRSVDCAGIVNGVALCHRADWNCVCKPEKSNRCAARRQVRNEASSVQWHCVSTVATHQHSPLCIHLF